MKPRTSIDKATSPLIGFCMGKSVAFPLIFPESLRYATKLPVKVTAPMATARKMTNPLKIPSGSDPEAAPPKNSKPATSRLAKPPNPLKRATISGIAVI